MVRLRRRRGLPRAPLLPDRCLRGVGHTRPAPRLRAAPRRRPGLGQPAPRRRGGPGGEAGGSSGRVGDLDLLRGLAQRGSLRVQRALLLSGPRQLPLQFLHQQLGGGGEPEQRGEPLVGRGRLRRLRLRPSPVPVLLAARHLLHRRGYPAGLLPRPRRGRVQHHQGHRVRSGPRGGAAVGGVELRPPRLRQHQRRRLAAGQRQHTPPAG